MASTLDMDVGVAPSKPARIKMLTIDASPVTSYATGGFLDAVLTAALAEFGATTVKSLPLENYNGTVNRYFDVDLATGKLVAFTESGLAVETTATDDLSGHTAIQVLLIGE